MRISSERRGGQEVGPPAELLKMHRHSLTTLLVIGGQAVDRRAVAYSFHRESPLKHGPFVAVDCRVDERRLRTALQALLANTAPDPGPDPVRAAWCGTLFLDDVEALPDDAQRLLLCFARHTLGGSVADGSGWPVRIAAGAREDFEPFAPSGILPELVDEIDKIRLHLDHVEVGAA
jgi:DNA-binding NtrC family response regulator